MKIKKLMLCIIVAVSLLSCKKDKKEYVEKGTNANTVKTFEFTVTSTSWIYDNNLNWHYTYTGAWETSLYGAVNVYLKSGTAYVGLPLTYSGVTMAYGFYPATGNIEIDLSGTSNPAEEIYRVVIIPPARIRSDVNYNNYQEVKKAFNLRD